MNDVPQFLAHVLHWVLLIGVVLCLVAGVLGMLSGRARTALPMLFGSMMLLGLAAIFVFGGGTDVGRLLSTMAPLMLGLVIGAVLGLGVFIDVEEAKRVELPPLSNADSCGRSCLGLTGARSTYTL